jgi:DNA-directed RNA polymerase subunit RPC12/RpoP
MPNENCLEDKACPQCKQTAKILVMASNWVAVTDDGTDAYDDDIETSQVDPTVEYDEFSAAQCPRCGFRGIWKDFDAV